MGAIKAFLRFLISKVFLINLGLVVIVAISIPYFTLSYLESSANNDSENYMKHYIPVPNFKGVPVERIDDFIGDRDIRYVISDSVFSDVAAAGTVIAQDPEPHIESLTDTISSYVKPGRRIYLTVVKKTGEYKTVPDLLTVNNSKDLAQIKLTMLGFQPTFESRANPKDGIVLDVKFEGKSIAPGTKLLKGSVIKVIYGSGGRGKAVNLPLLLGKTASNAEQILSLAGLESEVHYENALTAEDSVTFVVLKQSPHPKSVAKGVVTSGTRVSLIVGKPTLVTDSAAVNDPL